MYHIQHTKNKAYILYDKNHDKRWGVWLDLTLRDRDLPLSFREGMMEGFKKKHTSGKPKLRLMKLIAQSKETYEKNSLPEQVDKWVFHNYWRNTVQLWYLIRNPCVLILILILV